MTYKVWDDDAAAQMLHMKARALLDSPISELCPGKKLGQIGINRNEITGEVTLRLHLIDANAPRPATPKELTP